MSQAACGHGTEVAEDKCWDCHIANLRTGGDELRIARLEYLRKQRAECVLADWPELVNGMLLEYEKSWMKDHKRIQY